MKAVIQRVSHASVTIEEALKDGSRAYYTNAATLENIRIYRSGVDVTDCYDIRIEMTNNS